MRIATWNLEWAVPGTIRHDRALVQLESVDADIVVTTEDSLHDWDAYPYRIDGGPDWGYRMVDGRRKVIAWSRAPWTDVATIDHGAFRGRYVRGRISVDGVEVQVLAVCIPWRDAHVRSGRRDREGWDEHIEYCATLASEISGAAWEGPVVALATSISGSREWANRSGRRTPSPTHLPSSTSPPAASRTPAD